MGKKIFSFLTLVFIVFTMIACNGIVGSKFKLSEALIDANIPEYSYVGFQGGIVSVDTSGYSNSELFADGLLLVENEDQEQSILSLFTGKLLFPFEKDLVLRSDLDTIIKQDKNGTVEVFDFFGNVLIPKGEYENFNTSSTRQIKYDISGELTEFYYIVTVTYNKAGGEIVERNYKIDYLTKEFEELDSHNNLIEEVKKENLAVYGLQDYYGYKINNELYIFDRKDNLVNKINLSLYENYVITDGKLIYQIINIVDNNAKDYTFIDSNNKYEVVSKQIDLLTGKEKELKLDYIFYPTETLKNENGETVYALARVSKIKDKTLKEVSMSVLIDANGNILEEVPIYSFKNLYKINDKYFNLENRRFYDNKFIPISYLMYSDFIPSENWFVYRKDFNYGIVDSEYNEIVSFKYLDFGPEFVNDRLYAVDQAGNTYLINRDGSRVLVADNSYESELVYNGLILLKKFDESINKYIFKYVDFNLNPKFAFTISDPYNFTISNVSTLYGFYLIYTFEDNGVNTYVLIDMTKESLEAYQ